MEQSSTFERRYSFNKVQGNHYDEPIRHNRSGSFGSSSITPKHRSNSNLHVNNIFNASHNKLIKIDARVATDVQSKGLASRIVKYHDCGPRLSRSISAHNLYNKPGQFPAVTLNKTLLPHRATKQELSMIRIPPPEKSSFYGGTVSSLSKSSSVIGLQSKRNEVLSRENRPIIHPPPTESDMAPTRSVLDVLKEISRKRINNEDLDVEDTSKKYCNRPGNDVADTINNITPVPNYIASSLSYQRFKRQRDCIAPQKGAQLVEVKTSPEQSKKRICYYNNDITSSLSSSVKCRKILMSDNLKQITPANVEFCEIQKPKEQSYHNQYKIIDMGDENPEKALRKVDTTDCITAHSQEKIDTNGLVSKQTVSEHYGSNQKSTNSIQTANKPRLTLFNKKCNETETIETSASCKVIENYSKDYFDNFEGIPFVKPKNTSSSNSFKNPIIERTQKSKLALMLSGLKGELYKNIEAEDLHLENDTKKHEILVNCNINNGIKEVVALNSDNTVTPSTKATFSSKSHLNVDSIKSVRCTETQPTRNVPLPISSVDANNVDPSALLNTSSVINAFKDSKNTTKQISSISTNKMFKPKQSLSWSSDDPKSKLSSNIQSSTEKNLLQLPVVCSSFKTTTNACIPSNTITSLPAFNALTNDSNLSVSVPKSDTKLNAFNFCAPSTASSIATLSSAPIIIDTSTFSTDSIPSATIAATNDIVKFSSPASPIGLTNALSYTSDSTKNTHLSNGGVSFNVNRNLIISSESTFGPNNHSIIKTPPSTTFSFSSDTKIPNSSSCVQNNQRSHIGNNTCNLNSSVTFGSQCLNIQSLKESSPVFGNTTTDSKNDLVPTSTTTIYDSGSMEKNTKVLSANNDSSVSEQQPSYDSNNTTNNNPSHSFNFGKKIPVIPTTSTNSGTSVIGGFSFMATEPKCAEKISFGFGSNLNDKTKTVNSTFNNSFALDSLNTNFQFSLPTNKLDSCIKKSVSTPPSAFSFGSSTSVAPSTFNFGTNHSSENIFTTANINTSSSFAFSSNAISTPNTISTNKMFSFGSPQSIQKNQIHPTPSGSTDSINVFGLSEGKKITSLPSFNLNSKNSTNLNSNASTINNIFNPPAHFTTGVGDRPIRRATRRLQK